MGTRNARLTLLAQFTGLMSNILNAATTPKPKVTHENKIADTLEQGTGAGQVDFIYGAEARTLADTIMEDVDLFDLGTLDIGAGPGKDALGQSVAVVEIVALLIVVRTISAGRLKVGGKGTAAAFQSIFRDTLIGSPDDAALTLESGGCLLIFAPKDPAYSVADVSNHLLQMQALGGSVTYDIYFAARTV